MNHTQRPSQLIVQRCAAFFTIVATISFPGYAEERAESQELQQTTAAPTTRHTAHDWPQWGRNGTGNMVGPGASSIPVAFEAGHLMGRSDQIDPATTKHIKWIAKLGSNTYGNPTVADGRVYIGTNNDTPRNPKYKSDRSNIYCLDEQTGDLLWQLSAPKLGAGKVGDWEYLGICSSPTVDGDRVFFVSNRCEVICLDTEGMANGNDGPFKDEGRYAAGAGKPPIEIGPKDADIIWLYDMAGELGVFPHNITSSSVLVVGDRVYANTSNGVDYSHKHIINPRAPALIVLDRNTGQLVGEETAGISRRILHGNWSTPTRGTVGGKQLVFFGAGDGSCYAFDAVPVPADDGLPILTEQWRLDCNPPDYRSKDGAPVRYPTADGPSEIISTPVFHDGRVYVAIGQDPEHGEGRGALTCINADPAGHAVGNGLIWRYTDLNRAIATVSVTDGLLYIADYAGVVHCLDARSGDVQWTHDTLGHIWGSTLVTDGKVIVSNEDGIVTIFEAGRQKKLLAEVEFPGAIYSSPIVANDTLYIATMMHLYAIDARN